MSWLVGQTAEPERGQDSSDFWSRTVYVQRDLDTAEMVTETFQGHPCVCAYPSYELLVKLAKRDDSDDREDSDEVDHVMLTGRQLRQRLEEHPHIGIMFRPNLDDKRAIAWPEVAPVQRVTVE